MVKVVEINHLVSTTFVVLHHGLIILANQKRGDLSYLLVLRDGFLPHVFISFPGPNGRGSAKGLSEF